MKNSGLKTDGNLIRFISYPKTGNKWAQFLFGKYFQSLTGYKELLLLDGAEVENQVLRARELPVFLWTHAPLQWQGQSSDDLSHANVTAPFIGQRVILLIRHPLDTLLSSYNHHHFQKGHERRSKFPSFEAFVADPVYGIEKFFRFYGLWAERMSEGRVFILRYEDLKKDALATAEGCVRFMGSPVDRAAIDRAVQFASFDNMQVLERSGGIYYKSSGLSVFATGDVADERALHVRWGSSGLYRSFLTPDIAKIVEAAISTKLAPVYGYSERS